MKVSSEESKNVKQEVLSGCPSKMSQSPTQFLYPIQFLDLRVSRRESVDGGRGWVSRRKDCAIPWVSIYCNDLPSPSLKELTAIYSVCLLGNGNTQAFLGLVDPGSELTLITRDLKCHYGPTHEHQVIITGVPSRAQLTVNSVGV